MKKSDIEHELRIIRDSARTSRIVLFALLRYLKLEAVRETSTGLYKIQPRDPKERG